MAAKIILPIQGKIAARLSTYTGIFLVAAFVFRLSISARTVSATEAVTDEEILQIFYPGAQITLNDKKEFVLIGGAEAIEKVIGGGFAPKIITRIDRLKARLFNKKSENLVVLINAVNEDAPDCCYAEVVLGALNLQNGKKELLWLVRHDDYKEDGEISLVEAKTDGTQQILLTFHAARIRGLHDMVGTIYAPRTDERWYRTSHLEEFGKSQDNVFVSIWEGDLEYDESNSGVDMPTTKNGFSKAAYRSNIRFSAEAKDGWRDLLEERTITKLLGRPIEPPLTLQLRYYYLPGHGYDLKFFE